MKDKGYTVISLIISSKAWRKAINFLLCSSFLWLLAGGSFLFSSETYTLALAGGCGQVLHQKKLPNSRKDASHDLALEKIYLDSDGLIVLSISNKGKAIIPAETFSKIMVSVTVGQYEHLFYLGSVPAGQSGVSLDSRGLLRQPGSKFEAKTGLKLTSTSPVQAQLDIRGVLKETNLENNMLSVSLSPSKSFSGPSIARRPATKTLGVKSMPENTKETSDKNKEETAEEPAGSPDLAIESIEVQKTMPLSFRIAIKNVGSKDFLSRIFINIFWKTLPEGQEELVGGTNISNIIKAGDSTLVEATCSKNILLELLNAGKIKADDTQEIRFVLDPEGEEAEKENNQKSFQFFWNPPLIKVWAVNIGYPDPDYPVAIAVNQDETWLAVGDTTALETATLWFIKGDKSGNILWQKAFVPEEPGVSLETMALATVDDGSTIVLSRYLTKSKHSSLLLKIDQEGKLIWQNIISTEKDIYLKDIVRVPDGKIYLVGNALGEASSNDWHPIVICLASDGNPIWQKTFRGPAQEYFTKAALLEGGNVYLIGDQYIGNTSSRTSLIACLNQEGKMLWCQTFAPQMPGTTITNFRILGATKDGDIITSGRLTSPYAVNDSMGRFRPDGQRQWARAFSAMKPDCVLEEPAGSILVGGGGTGISGQTLLLHLRQDGSPDWGSWHGVYTGSNNYIFFMKLARTPDGGILGLAEGNIFSLSVPLSSSSDQFVRYTDMIVMKFDPNGNGALKLWDWARDSGDKGPVNLSLTGQKIEMTVSETAVTFSPAKLKEQTTEAKVSQWGNSRYVY